MSIVLLVILRRSIGVYHLCGHPLSNFVHVKIGQAANAVRNIETAVSHCVEGSFALLVRQTLVGRFMYSLGPLLVSSG